MLIGPPSTAALAPLPPLLEAAVAQIHVQVGIERLRATAFARERALRFPLTPAMRDALDAGARVSLVCTHPRYFWRRRLPIPTLRELRRELGEHRAGGAHADGQAGTRRFQPTARSTAA